MNTCGLHVMMLKRHRASYGECVAALLHLLGPDWLTPMTSLPEACPCAKRAAAWHHPSATGVWSTAPSQTFVPSAPSIAPRACPPRSESRQFVTFCASSHCPVLGSASDDGPRSKMCASWPPTTPRSASWPSTARSSSQKRGSKSQSFTPVTFSQLSHIWE